MAEAVRWGRRGARINTISPGIIMTPLARDELTGPRGEGYRRMIDVSSAGRAGTLCAKNRSRAFIQSRRLLVAERTQRVVARVPWQSLG